MPNKVLPGNETVLLIPVIEISGVPNMVAATTLVPYTAPTKALLDRYIAITSNGAANSGSGGNISDAVRDDMTLGLTDSSLDKDRAVTATGASEALTFFNFNAKITCFVDADPTSTTSVFNMANDLLRAPDAPYIICHRIGPKKTDLVTLGEEWDFYYAWTDNPTPVYSDGGNQLMTQAFIPKNIVNTAYAVAA